MTPSSVVTGRASALRIDPVELARVRAHDKRPSVSHQRQELMHELRDAGWSYTRIALKLDRSRAAVIQGIRAHCWRNDLPWPEHNIQHRWHGRVAA